MAAAPRGKPAEAAAAAPATPMAIRPAVRRDVALAVVAATALPAGLQLSASLQLTGAGLHVVEAEAAAAEAAATATTRVVVEARSIESYVLFSVFALSDSPSLSSSVEEKTNNEKYLLSSSSSTSKNISDVSRPARAQSSHASVIVVPQERWREDGALPAPQPRGLRSRYPACLGLVIVEFFIVIARPRAVFSLVSARLQASVRSVPAPRAAYATGCTVRACFFISERGRERARARRR